MIRWELSKLSKLSKFEKYTSTLRGGQGDEAQSRDNTFFLRVYFSMDTLDSLDSWFIIMGLKYPNAIFHLDSLDSPFKISILRVATRHDIT